MLKDIKQPLLDETDRQVQVHQKEEYEGGTTTENFYTKQLDEFQVVKLDKK